MTINTTTAASLFIAGQWVASDSTLQKKTSESVQKIQSLSCMSLSTPGVALSIMK